MFRADLWSPECWREQSENRRKRREQLRVIARRLDAVPRSVPVMVGGDFNAPQGDAVFRLLQPRLHDTFREGGQGWGNTITNDFPFLRIDQIWASRAFLATKIVAGQTQHSDHRMVICDLTLRRLDAAGSTRTLASDLASARASSAGNSGRLQTRPAR